METPPSPRLRRASPAILEDAAQAHWIIDKREKMRIVRRDGCFLILSRKISAHTATEAR